MGACDPQRVCATGRPQGQHQLVGPRLCHRQLAALANGHTRRAAQVVVQGEEDAVFEAAMEAGAEDIVPVEAEDGPTSSYKVRHALPSAAAGAARDAAALLLCCTGH